MLESADDPAQRYVANDDYCFYYVIIQQESSVVIYVGVSNTDPFLWIRWSIYTIIAYAK